MSGGRTDVTKSESAGPIPVTRVSMAGPIDETRPCTPLTIDGITVRTVEAMPESMGWTAAPIWAKVSMIPDASTCGRPMSSAPPTELKMPASASAAIGATADTAPEIADGSCAASDTPMRWTAGPTLFATSPMDETSWLVSLPMSAPSVPRPASQFSHAAFAELREPSMVVVASLAVVPVMSRFSCTAWMALMMSLNLDGSSASPVSLLASATSRSSSVLVPP